MLLRSCTLLYLIINFPKNGTFDIKKMSLETQNVQIPEPKHVNNIAILKFVTLYVLMTSYQEVSWILLYISIAICRRDPINFTENIAIMRTFIANYECVFKCNN